MDMAKASALYYHRYLLEHENQHSTHPASTTMQRSFMRTVNLKRLKPQAQDDGERQESAPRR